ncbi:MAG: Mur ligase family protein [Candidatus Komeilibacteria bacterium]|nr:Mur ligase family protein [Candidatus Komeilibacteria bacterium]
MKLADLKNKKIHLIGISGAESSSLALFLASLGIKNLIGHDFKTAAEFKRSFFNYHDNLNNSAKNALFDKLKTSFKKINFKNSYLAGIKEAEIIFAPASYFRYPQNRPLVTLKAQGRVKIWNWYNLLLEFYPGLLIGVTGTAGKGTVTNLLYQILKTAKKKVWLAGESWHYLDLARIFKTGQQGIVVAEVNNRTLLLAGESKKSPSVAIITNIFPHHLDDHHNSFAEYKKVKLEIRRYQKPGDLLIVNGQDPEIAKLAWPKKTIIYNSHNAQSKLINNKNLIAEHLKSDAVAAIIVAKTLKIGNQAISRALGGFKPRSGRLEPIRNYQGIQFINDGAATRLKSTIEALNSFPAGKIILILEGSRKAPEKMMAEYLKLIKAIKERKVKAVIVSGRIRKFLLPLLLKAGLNAVPAANLAGATKQASAKAKKNDIVLLSPAHESFGEFADYRARSEKFKELVNQLP